jgi:hypothetical protein
MHIAEILNLAKNFLLAQRFPINKHHPATLSARSQSQQQLRWSEGSKD